MTDPDPELQAILRKKAVSLQKTVSFFDKVNRDGITHVTDNNIDEIIQKSPLPVLVDFSADVWRGQAEQVIPVDITLCGDLGRRQAVLGLHGWQWAADQAGVGGDALQAVKTAVQQKGRRYQGEEGHSDCKGLFFHDFSPERVFKVVIACIA